jgi:hypothetical protein
MTPQAGDDGWQEVLRRIVHENGPVVLDFMGDDLAWRPLDYGTWTPLPTPPAKGTPHV